MKTNKKHIENEFPTLEKLKGQNGMRTPEGYFDSLTDSIMSKVSEPEKSTDSHRYSFYKVFAYAASIALVIGISSTLFFSKAESNSPDFFGEMTVNEYLNDLSEIDLELDENFTFDEMASY